MRSWEGDCPRGVSEHLGALGCHVLYDAFRRVVYG